MTKIFVGNISSRTSSSAIEALFARHGMVEEVALATDKETGDPRGFGFVFMPDEKEARAAIAAVNGRLIDGKTLSVSISSGKKGKKKGPQTSQRPRGGSNRRRMLRRGGRPRGD